MPRGTVVVELLSTFFFLFHTTHSILIRVWVALVVCCLFSSCSSSSSSHRTPLYEAHLSSPRLLWSNCTFCLMMIWIALMCCLCDHLGDSLGLLSLVMSPPTTWVWGKAMWGQSDDSPRYNLCGASIKDPPLATKGGLPFQSILQLIGHLPLSTTLWLKSTSSMLLTLVEIKSLRRMRRTLTLDF